MCGRFTMVTPGQIIAEAFGLGDVPELAPRYNIAPSQQVAVVRDAARAGRELGLLRWGLIPPWAKDRSFGVRMINARAETVMEKPAFRAAFRARRCLIVADGFYEWQKLGDRKRPHHIRMADGRPFGFAGLWESWTGADGQTVESCAIVTTTPNEVLAPIHDRMPAIVEPESYAAWLDPTQRDAAVLAGILRPYAAGAMVATPVSLVVNNPANDAPECIWPA
ncbi:MAG: SOS response-associated peptidase [Acidobacteriota bacterium]